MLPAERRYAYIYCGRLIPRRIFFVSLLLLSVLIFSCTKEVYLTGEALVRDGKYDSSYPHLSTAEYIEEIIKSVQPVSSNAYYSNYYFSAADQVTESALREQNFKEMAISQEPSNTNVRGSATIIYSGDRRVALLTSAHVVDFPDTILTYYTDLAGRNTEYLQSIAVKTRQMNYVSTLPRLRDKSLEIIAIDRQTDVAIIGGVDGRGSARDCQSAGISTGEFTGAALGGLYLCARLSKRQKNGDIRNC
jgi:hypothetical protein